MPTPQTLPALIKEMQERARDNRPSKHDGTKIVISYTKEEIDTLITDTTNATLEYVKGVARELTLNNGSEGDDALKDLIARLTSNPE